MSMLYVTLSLRGPSFLAFGVKSHGINQKA